MVQCFGCVHKYGFCRCFVQFGPNCAGGFSGAKLAKGHHPAHKPAKAHGCFAKVQPKASFTNRRSQCFASMKTNTNLREIGDSDRNSRILILWHVLVDTLTSFDPLELQEMVAMKPDPARNMCVLVLGGTLASPALKGERVGSRASGTL